MPLAKYLSLTILFVLSFLTIRATVDSIEVIKTNTLCYDSCNARAIVFIQANTSTGPFRVVWRSNVNPTAAVIDTVLSSDTIFNRCAGEYSVQITDLSDASVLLPYHFTIVSTSPMIGNFSLYPPSCFDSIDGKISVSMGGGTGPYSYLWDTGDPADTNTTLDTIPAGMYILTVTDAEGCSYIDSVNLIEPGALNVNTGKIDVLCKDDCNGQVFANPSGGIAPYHYLWDNSDTNRVLNNLCPAKFVVTVTDDSGCVAVDSIILSEPDTMMSSYDIVNASCNDVCNGKITSTITGGTRPYTYRWSGYSQTDSVLNNACAGTLSATVVDANGCYLQEDLNITEPDALSIDDSTFNSSCGMCDGELKVFPNGGSGIYFYLWPGQKAEDTIYSIDSLCAGQYMVTITDTNLCTDTFSLNLSDDTAGIKDIGFLASKSSCANVCDGALQANPIGGTLPYTYLWSPSGQTDSVITGLCPGEYTVEVTDGSGCKRIETFSVGSKSTLTASKATTAVSCIGNCDGMAQIDVGGGSAPYSFVWSGRSESGNSLGSVCSGSYPVVVSDANGCQLNDTLIVPTGSNLGISVSTTDATCSSGCDGTAMVNLSNGSPPFTYNWSTGETSDSIFGLCSGSYWIEVTDGNGCIQKNTFSINTGAQFQVNEVIENADCGVSNGNIKVAASGGTAPYQYLWFNNTYGDSVSGLTPGVYWLMTEDANGCQAIDSFAVSSNGGPDLNFNVTHESCQNGCDGSIVVQASGTNGPYSYEWVPSYSSQSSKSVGGLCPGVYYSKVTDGKGCVTIDPVRINRGLSFSISFDEKGPSCVSSCDGNIIAQVSGGIPPYQYIWSNASNQPAISNLCAGSYSLTVIDALNCSVTKTIELDEPEQLEVNLEASNLLCYNQCNGIVTSEVTGGAIPYTYVWSTGASGGSAGSLCAGSYWVTVYDANGCSASDSISIGNGIPINVSFSKNQAGCELSNGSITASASGGNGIPYSYSWSIGDDSSYTGDLIAGTYEVTVTDNAGCSGKFTTYLSNNNGPSVSDTALSASCFSNCDGIAVATGSGTTSPYLTQWQDPSLQTGDSAIGLCAGTLIYSITDASGCMTFDSVMIKEPLEIQTNYNVNHVSCSDGDDGSITVNAQGEFPPFQYQWSTGDTNVVADTLAAGQYWVVVTDSDGCTASDTIEIVEPNPISISFSTSNTSCFNSCNGMIVSSVTGETAPFTYVWNDPSNQIGSIATGLCPGYTVLTVTDANGCTAVDSALVTAPTTISLTPVLNNPGCADGNNGSISLTAMGGSPPYKFYWTHGKTGSMVTGLKAGKYFVTVIDSSLCSYTDSFTLVDPSPLQVNFNFTLPTCGNMNGSVSALVSGGSGSYSFLWNTLPARVTSNINNLWAGTYQVTVTDNNSGCVVSKRALLNNTGGPSIAMTSNDESCPNGCNGQALASTPSGSYSFLWDDAGIQTDSNATGLCAGFYTVRVTDQTNGCVSFDSVTIGTLDYYVAISNTVPVNCYGDCSGMATATASGGLPPIMYSWNTIPVQTTATAIDLCVGSYFVSASDSNNCSTGAIAVINQPDTLEVEVHVINHVTCNGTCSGRARAMVSGGTAPYTFLWNGISGSDVATNLCQGINSVTITDYNGCVQTLNFNIQNNPAIQANPVIIPSTCGNYDGSIALSPTGGSGPYFYKWSNGEASAEVTGLFAGVYTVEITDASGCKRSFTYFLNNPNAPNLQFSQNTVLCSGDCNGIARVTPVGGVGPFTYLWNHVPISMTDSLTGLCAGAYIVKVTDASGCIAFGADTITEPPLLTGNISVVTDGCGGKCDGEAMIVPMGGTLPLNYMWNTTPPQSSPNATGLCAGFVEVTITDNNNCTYSDSIEVTPPPELMIDSLDILNATCFNNADGEITVYFSGGTSPIDILWSDLQTTNTAIDLINGTYIVEITDVNGCMGVDTAIVAVTDTVMVKAFVDSFLCIGENLLLLGTGMGTTVYQWFIDSSGVLLPIATGDSVMYPLDDTTTFILRGQNSAVPPCFDFDTAYVVGIPPPNIDAGSDVTINKGSFTNLLASPFLFNGSYAWAPSAGLNDTAAIDPVARPDETTLYTVFGTDQFGCTANDSVRVTVVEDDDIINGFSPNGDGVNDVWLLPFLEDYPNSIVKVYNRWGILVFESEEGYITPWDGNFEGNSLPAASYYYTIDLFGDGSDVKTGPVTILY